MDRGMRIQSFRCFHGPNLWSRRPVMWVDLGDEPADSLEPKADRASLLDAVLNGGRAGSAGVEIDGAAAPVEAPLTAWAGWLAVTFQRLCDVPVEQWFSDPTGFGFEFEHERVGRAAAHLAVRLLNHQRYGSEDDFDLVREVARLGRLNRAYDHGPVGRAFTAAAARRGVPVRMIDRRRRIVELGTGRYQQRVLGTMTSRTTSIADRISRNKALANRYLAEAGLPVPKAALARDVDEACDRAAGIGYPVVLKPIDQADSHLVFVDIRDEAELRTRFAEVRAGLGAAARHVVVEQFVRGSIYRALVVGDQVVGVFQRVPAHVFGDGASSVRTLVEQENAQPRRQRAELLPIEIDDASMLVLERQGLTPDSVPEAGRRVELKPQIGHRRDGGLARECTDEVHPANARLLVHATRAIGLDVAGIDFVTGDCSRPLVADGGAIIEVNSAPDFDRHLRPSEGLPRDGAAAVIDLLFPPGEPVRAEVVAVCGGPDSALVVETISAMLAAAGRAVASVAGRHLTVDGLSLGPVATSHRGAELALNHPLVEVAVLEVEPREIIDHGLPFDVCDVAVVLAVPEGAVDAVSVLRRSIVPGGWSIVTAADAAGARIESEDGRRVNVAVLGAGGDPSLRTASVWQQSEGDGVLLVIDWDGRSERIVLDKPSTDWMRAAIAAFVAVGGPLHGVEQYLQKR